MGMALAQIEITIQRPSGDGLDAGLVLADFQGELQAPQQQALGAQVPV